MVNQELTLRFNGRLVAKLTYQERKTTQAYTRDAEDMARIVSTLQEALADAKAHLAALKTHNRT